MNTDTMTTTAPTAQRDALGSTGLSQWSGVMGADPDNTLAMFASIMGGVAAPVAFMDMPWGIVPLPKLHAVVPESQGVLSHTLDHLLSPARRVNRQILATMAGINPVGLRQLMYGTLSGDPAKITWGFGSTESKAIQAIDQEVFGGETGSIPSGENDLRPDPKLCRLEAVTRPGIVLECPAPSRLVTLLRHCHLSHALAVGIPLCSIAEPSKAKKEIAALLRSMHGTELEIPVPKYPVSIEHNRLAGIQSVSTADPNGLRKMFPLLSPVLEQSLLLTNTPPEFISSAHSEYFSKLFSTTVSRVITLRRNSIPLQVSFENPEDAYLFQERFVSFQSECDSTGVTVGASVRNLPYSLAWALIILQDHMHTYEPPSDKAVIESVFKASENLLKRHCSGMAELGTAAMRDEAIKRIRAIVRKVEEKKNVTPSNLARSFDDQRIGLYKPLIQLLANEGVLRQTSDGKIRPGERPLEDVLPYLLLPSLEEP